ncbi:MAG: septum formation protein Maf [Clostridia bacterium]|nr:septum formation protein Maf [Clostridia bacterium]
MEIILASKSPRRNEILKKAGYEFKIIESSFNESTTLSSPIETCKYFALEKAKDVFNGLQNKENVLVLGADTIVYLDGKILGKPKNEEDAKKMLQTLSGKAHYVYTGYAIVYKDKIINDYDQTEVIFNTLNEEIINEYVKTGSPLDKAGAYGIQDDFNLVKEIKGSLNNVIGLPIEKINIELNKIIKKGL